mmetsp:Transcript_16325/g.26180  ORF Transcript_16325/g.26180 Transcript_16325/m.26180 type:complete len:239 (+) Transcript_16325:539-1255(+)
MCLLLLCISFSRMCASLLCVSSSPSLMRDSLPSAIFSSLCGALTFHSLACFSVSLYSTIRTPCHTLSHSSCTRIRPSLLYVSCSLMHDCQSCHVPFSLLSFFLSLPRMCHTSAALDVRRQSCSWACLQGLSQFSRMRLRLSLLCDSHSSSNSPMCHSRACILVSRASFSLPASFSLHASLSVFRSDSFSGILSGASQFKFLLFASLSQATMSFLSELLSDVPFFQIHRMTFFPMCHIQ